VNRLAQRLMCRFVYGCFPCNACWPLRHCVHCDAVGARFIDPPALREGRT
jgi:hypothetical protein